MSDADNSVSQSCNVRIHHHEIISYVSYLKKLLNPIYFRLIIGYRTGRVRELNNSQWWAGNRSK